MTLIIVKYTPPRQANITPKPKHTHARTRTHARTHTHTTPCNLIHVSIHGEKIDEFILFNYLTSPATGPAHSPPCPKGPAPHQALCGALWGRVRARARFLCPYCSDTRARKKASARRRTDVVEGRPKGARAEGRWALGAGGHAVRASPKRRPKNRRGGQKPKRRQKAEEAAINRRGGHKPKRWPKFAQKPNRRPKAKRLQKTEEAAKNRRGGQNLDDQARTPRHARGHGSSNL